MIYMTEKELKDHNMTPKEFLEGKFEETLYNETEQKFILEDVVNLGNVEYVKSLTNIIKESKHDFKEVSSAAIQAAATNGNIEIADYLLEQGANSDIAEEHGTGEIKDLIADRERKSFSERLKNTTRQAKKQIQAKQML
jgi:hypothetical protein